MHRKKSTTKQANDMLPFMDSITPFIQAIDLGLWKWELNSNHFICNQHLELLLGYKLNTTNMKMTSKQDLDNRKRLLNQLIQGELVSFTEEYPILNQNGSYLWIQENCAVTEHNSDGTAAVILGSVNDISKVKRVTEQEEHQKHWNDVAQMAGFASWIWDIEKDYVYFNPEFENLMGYKPEEANGNLAFMANWLQEDWIEPMTKSFQKYIANGGQGYFNMELPCIRRDGTPIWLYNLGSVAKRNDKGNPIVLRGALLNIDKRIKAEEQLKAALAEKEQYNKRLEKEVKKAVHNLEQQSTLLMAVNTAAESLMADVGDESTNIITYALEVLGKSVLVDRVHVWENILVDNNFCSHIVAEWQRYPKPSTTTNKPILEYDTYIPNWKQLLPQTLFFQKDNMSERMLEFRAATGNGLTSFMLIPIILEGDFWGLIGFDNLEEHKEFSSEEIQILRSGGMLVASAITRSQMTHNLIAAREEALASTKAKGEFLSRMSHEIRTPMNAIIGMTTVAQKATDLDRAFYCLEKIDSSSRQLLSLINDILDMSKIDADKLEILSEEFDFERMLDDLFNVVQVKLEEKHQEFFFNFDQPLTHKIISDELRLKQVLLNLLSNAIKFTPDRGHVTLNVHIIPLDETHATLKVSVTDTGIGIEEERIHEVFNSFEQADGSITRKFGGTGLGLAISKRIIDLMGGHIWVESTLGEGSSFSFEIDVEWGCELGDELSRNILQKNLRILVVDDVPDILEFFQNILYSFHLQCDIAENGEEAICKVSQAIAENRSYDLVFMDWMMPGMDGIEAAKQIRNITNDQAIVIMISAADWNEIEAEAKTAKLHHFLAKPILPSVLYNKLLELSNSSPNRSENIQEHNIYDWSNKTLLLVEDIEINREIIISILEETGIVIDSACDGIECIEMVENNPNRYDLILMDVQMPRMDGLEATRTIRAMKHGNGKRVPIIAMTANAFKEDALECIEAGMDEHLAKPLEINTFYATLTKYLHEIRTS